MKSRPEGDFIVPDVRVCCLWLGNLMGTYSGNGNFWAHLTQPDGHSDSKHVNCAPLDHLGSCSQFA